MTACPVCGRPKPTRTYQERCRATCSRSCGYTLMTAARVAANADVDPVSVARMVTGDTPTATTRGERIAATAWLLAHGHSQSKVATLIRVTPRTVARYAAEIHQRKEKAA
jgi:hypothetical protein